MPNKYGFGYSRGYLYVEQDKASFLEISEQDRDILSVGARYELFDDNFIEVQNIRNMTKNEDYNQGLMITLGFAANYEQITKKWGQSFNIEFSKNTFFNEFTLLLASANFETRKIDHHLDESRITTAFELNSFSTNFQQSWNVKFKYESFSNPTPEHLLIMDEEFTIRGYPFGYRLSDTVVG